MVIFLKFTPKNELHEKFENSLQTSLERNFVHLIYIYIYLDTLLGGKKKSGHVHWSILQLKDHFANMGIHYNRFSIRSIKKKRKRKRKEKQTNKQRRSTMESGESNDKKGKKKRKKERGMRWITLRLCRGDTNKTKMTSGCVNLVKWMVVDDICEKHSNLRAISSLR